MSWDDGLTGTHKDIASYEGKCLRVRAGPGTGKTYALMRRITKLIEDKHDPSKILVVTFTKTAARDLKNSLQQLDVPNIEDIHTGTLHSIAFKLLSQRSVFSATGRVPRPMNKFEINCLITDLATKFGGKKNVKKLLLEFDAYWATLQHLEPGWPQDPERSSFQIDLREWLSRHEAILIGELIPIALDYLNNNPSSVHGFTFEHVLVDEYQDLNKADQNLIDLFARGGTITIVGDENQSIYGFRHAHPDGIINYKESHPLTHDEQLDECRRCPKKIVEMANTLISFNKLYLAPKLKILESNAEGIIHIVQHDSIEEEVKNIALFINNYLDINPDRKLSDILVLSPRKQIGYDIRDHLLNLERSAKSFFLEEALEKTKSQEGFCLLNLLINNKDKVSLRTWLCIDKTTARQKQYQKCLEEADKKEIDIFNYMDFCIEELTKDPKIFNNHIKDLISRYSILKHKLSDCQNKNILDLVDFLWPPGDKDCEEIRGLAIAISHIVKTPKELLDELQLIITQPESIIDDEDNIRIMSLHKSKGLTAKCVIIVGCVAGLIPQSLNDNIPQILVKKFMEEQRRLFYVAITRTTETLVLSHSSMSTYNQAMKMNMSIASSRKDIAILQASPFISELGDPKIKTLSGRQWVRDLKIIS